MRHLEGLTGVFFFPEVVVTLIHFDSSSTSGGLFVVEERSVRVKGGPDGGPDAGP